jgi:hypothetical protein
MLQVVTGHYPCNAARGVAWQRAPGERKVANERSATAAQTFFPGGKKGRIEFQLMAKAAQSLAPAPPSNPA